MALPASIQPVEIIWAGASVIGLTAQARGLADSIGDYIHLKRDGKNGPRKIVAWNNIRTQVCACMMHVLFMTVGIVAMTQTPTNPHAPVTVTAIVLTVVLFGANVLLVGNAVWSRRSRAHLEREIDKIEGLVGDEAKVALVPPSGS